MGLKKGGGGGGGKKEKKWSNEDCEMGYGSSKLSLLLTGTLAPSETRCCRADSFFLSCYYVTTPVTLQMPFYKK